MIFEDTDSQEEMFLAFSAGGISYVLPLADVGQIVVEVPKDMPEITISGQKGGCAVIIQDDLGFTALTVGKVDGIVRLPPACQYEMPKEARSHNNRWIAGVAFAESSKKLCYLLDCRQLRARFMQEQL
jgi:hypothetical protein